MQILKALALAAVTLAGLPALAQAAPAVSTANVNMRSGPSTGYPPVQVIPAGMRVEIHGCLQSANWCDVSFARYRGWVSGSYLQAAYSQRRVYVDPQYYRPLGIPTVTFSVGTYWDRHYRQRDFYRERDRWRDFDRRMPPPPMRDDRGPGRGPGWDRDRDGRDAGWDRGPDRDGDGDRDWDRGRDDRGGPGWDRDRRGDDGPREVRRDDDRRGPGPDRAGPGNRDPRMDPRENCPPGQQFDRGRCR